MNADNPKTWPPDLREQWEERAGIIEDGCSVDRPTSERMATAQMRPLAFAIAKEAWEKRFGKRAR